MSLPPLSKRTCDRSSVKINLMALSRRPRLPIMAAAIFIFTCMASFTYRSHDTIAEHVFEQVQKAQGKYYTSILDVKNRTLGFSKVFIIGMPERVDKRDSVTLAASFSGIDFEWVDGVKGAEIPGKALPLGWDENESNATLGCWRAHMNVAQRIVKEGIQSALVLEDDADWDVMLKEQLLEFSRGTRFLQGAETSKSEFTGNSPYGDDWDLLWLGHCGAKNRENQDSKYWIVHDDPTAIPDKLYGYRNRMPNFNTPLLSGNHTRVVFEAARALCTTGYAISSRGAHKLLYHQSVLGQAAVSDRALNKVCTPRYMGMQCFAPYPALLGSHRAAGLTGKDSDRIGAQLAGGFREVPETAFIVFPTRVNMERLIVGETARIPSQYPADSVLTEIDRTVELPQGEGVFVRQGEYGEDEDARWRAAHPELVQNI